MYISYSESRYNQSTDTIDDPYYPEVYVARSDDLVNWDNIRVTNAINYSGYSEIAVDSEGRLHLTFEDNRTGLFCIYYKRSPGFNESVNLCLRTGWNFVTMPVNVSMNAGELASVINEQISPYKVLEISKWDDYTQRWSTWIWPLPQHNNFTIEAGRGYAIHISDGLSSAEVSIEGLPINEPVDVNLSKGWNLVGIPYAESTRNASDVMALNGNITAVCKWDINGYWVMYSGVEPDYMINESSGYYYPLDDNGVGLFIRSQSNTVLSPK